MHSIIRPLVYLQDLDKCVTVYAARPEDTQKPWHFLAKHRSHVKKIEGESSPQNGDYLSGCAS